MAKNYITDSVSAAYKDSLKKLFQDLGRTITIKVRTGHNPAIPWDNDSNAPQDMMTYPDESVWYTYDTYTIYDVAVIYPDEQMIYFSAGMFDPQDIKLYCLVKDALVNKDEPNGQTYFDLEGLESITVEGEDYIRKNVVRKIGLTDRYICDVTVTRKAE